MIGVSIKVEGLDKLRKKLKEAPKRVGRAISRAIKDSGFELERAGKEALTMGATRAIDTGTLRSQNVVRELSDVRVAMYPLVDYAIYVHEGTKFMRPRPWMRAAARAVAPIVSEIFDEEISKIMED